MVCHVPTGDDWYLSQSQIDLASSNDGNSLDSKRSAQQWSPHPAGRSWRLPRGQGAETGLLFGMPCTLGTGTSTPRGSTAMKRMSALRFASLSIAAYDAGRTEYAGK